MQQSMFQEPIKTSDARPAFSLKYPAFRLAVGTHSKHLCDAAVVGGLRAAARDPGPILIVFIFSPGCWDSKGFAGEGSQVRDSK